MQYFVTSIVVAWMTTVSQSLLFNFPNKSSPTGVPWRWNPKVLQDSAKGSMNNWEKNKSINNIFDLTMIQIMKESFYSRWEMSLPYHKILLY